MARCAALDLMACRVDQMPSCLKCRDTKVVRNGQAGGLPRHNCRGCGGTLIAPTGTPLGRLRQHGQWLRQAQALDEA